ncbi:hypothetical protein SAMN05444141_102649 [Pseudovibrio denitrificans]|uniref:Uncharacterized protein n=1 Tax=Pseudovibrio denitrificans TaxID=258256 RepID=A0A1I6ZVX3_9HYPH|nr:hypothetical protein [Pseudovibrio denitrificans]SFT66848.1 hypothetical protein SAMN05444141_102649 [Pseudovibrio denitrificans]
MSATFDAAKEHLQILQDHWFKRGYRVSGEIQSERINEHDYVYNVRTDLVNGQPKNYRPTLEDLQL